MPHSLRVFVGEGRGEAAPLALTPPGVGGGALALRLVGLRLDRLGVLGRLVGGLTAVVRVLLPLAPLGRHLAVLRGRGDLVGLLHFEEHWGGGAVLHRPGYTD